MKKQSKKFLLIFLIMVMLIQIILTSEGVSQNFLKFSINDNNPCFIDPKSVDNYTSLSKGTWQMSAPAIAIDSGDVKHIIWSEYNITYSSYNIVYVNSSTNFNSARIISNISINDFEPSIAIDSFDTLHIVWKGSGQIYYSNSSSNFNNYTIISNQNDVSAPNIGCDATGTVHIIWLARHSNVYNWDVFYANSSDNYLNLVNISQNSATADEEADISVGGGIVYIIWSRKFSNSKYKIMESNSTSNFAQRNTISLQYTLIYGPKADVDNAGNLHVVWFGKKNNIIPLHEIIYLWFVYIYMPYYNDESLVPKLYKSFTPPLFLYSLYREGNYHIYYSNSSDFGVDFDVSHIITQEAYTPDILLDSNNVAHIVWTGFVKSEKYYPISRVYYTNSSQNFRTFRNFAMVGYEKYPRIANDSTNKIHCVFQSTIFYSFFFGEDIHHICYINSSNLAAWPPQENPLFTPPIIIRRPFILDISNMTVLAIILLSALGVLNSVVFVIIYQQKKVVKENEKVRDLLRKEMK